MISRSAVTVAWQALALTALTTASFVISLCPGAEPAAAWIAFWKLFRLPIHEMPTVTLAPGARLLATFTGVPVMSSVPLTF
ncbi:hypothetical protein D3C78_1614340 [compost metagenome]